jgi:molybdopterin converting factor small subunit
VTAVKLEVWVYGELTRFTGKEGAYARFDLDIPEGTTIGGLLETIGVPTEERGLTFVNGAISAFPGLQPDLGHTLHDGDRVGIFPEVSMLPFHYREGAPVVEELADAIQEMGVKGIAHDFRER